MKGIQFLVDDAGRKTAVLIDLKKNAKMWEDFYDRLLVRERAAEPRESLEEVKQQIARAKKKAHG